MWNQPGGTGSGFPHTGHGGPSEAPLQPPRLQGGEASRLGSAVPSVRTLPFTCPRRRAAPSSPTLRTRTHVRFEASQLRSPRPLRRAGPSLGHAQPAPASVRAAPLPPGVPSRLRESTLAGGRAAPSPDLRPRARLKLVLLAQFALCSARPKGRVREGVGLAWTRGPDGSVQRASPAAPVDAQSFSPRGRPDWLPSPRLGQALPARRSAHLGLPRSSPPPQLLPGLAVFAG